MWVPHRFFPDKYDTGEGPPRVKTIKAGRYGVSRRDRLISGSSGEQDNVLKKLRYCKHLHEQAFLSSLKPSPFNGVVPKKKAGVELLISKLPFDPAKTLLWAIDTVRNAYKRLAKTYMDITTNCLH